MYTVLFLYKTKCVYTDERKSGRAYLCERRVGADVTQRDEELIDAGVGQPDGRRAAVQRRLQNSSSSVHSYRTTGTNVYTSAIAP